MTQGLPDDLFAGDPDAIERGLDEWVAGFERNAARYTELAERVQDVRLTATSADGSVTVTVDANGVLKDAQFSDKISHTPPAELSRQLLGAIDKAKAGIAATVREVATETLGEDARDSADRIVGHYQERFADVPEPDQTPAAADEELSIGRLADEPSGRPPRREPPPRRRRPPEDDEDFGADSFLR
ncbi:YbaB/EbfC DNA-binding family protein [Herbihabitans rhizosphaerae]|uniref:YbaB/EbfC DNA-binding family protein n=1 Tax=Herbihabitans rhizosphaerae TaxID=1872711 RepID=A0A4Q7KB77_9PSEU|nr:YbaB/EbfC family nucleoid-associated protein [Herbihabitans rhizosphaerae]RZS29533.1 YbaB/EbfC DNA-binding family protein [Herbihabitans rhizosphaerae]